MKYPKARKLWFSCQDSRGFSPCHYAAKAGHSHLDVLAYAYDEDDDYNHDDELDSEG